ncbi:MAG: TIGR03118 family protein [Acidobacteria bacterium]|nr:TIGR03118 family protein [Acidobacteriota bacterium]
MSPNHSKHIVAVAAIVFTVILTASSALAQHFTRTDLTANAAGVGNAAHIDPNLVNAWGLSRASGSPWWVADQATGLSTLYDATGLPQSLVVTIPLPNGQSGSGSPTGTVFNAFPGAFELIPGQRSIFLFSTLAGTIAGWNPNVNPTVAVIKADASAEHAVYTGLAIADTNKGPRLFAANFSLGEVTVFNKRFNKVTTAGGFKDAALPMGYAPFGIQNVGGNIVVAFAQPRAGEPHETHGPGKGFVDVFDTDGNLLLRLQHNSTMNAPWGIAQAPGDFGPFSHRLLIGNFGDGKINAYNPVSGKREGTLLDPNGAPIAIDGLWAISFGGGNTNSGLFNDLYFSSGPNEETNGLFGKLTPTGSEQRGNSE